MRRRSRIRVVRYLKWTWIVAHLLVLQLSLSPCSDGASCFQVHDNFISGALVLGFPGSFLAMLAAITLFRGATGSNDIILLWLGAFIGGYVQWFVLLPRLLKVSKPLSLGLSQIQSARVPVEVSIPVSIPVPVINPVPTKKVKKKRMLRTTTISQFDSKGRTPLERALANTKLRS
jgi:hypothetical protein